MIAPQLFFLILNQKAKEQGSIPSTGGYEIFISHNTISRFEGKELVEGEKLMMQTMGSHLVMTLNTTVGDLVSVSSRASLVVLCRACRMLSLDGVYSFQ